MVTDIAEDSERLLGIIENLLLLSRMQSGTSSELEPQVLTHVIRHEIGVFPRRHPERDIRLVGGSRTQRRSSRRTAPTSSCCSRTC